MEDWKYGSAKQFLPDFQSFSLPYLPLGFTVFEYLRFYVKDRFFGDIF